MVACIKSTKLWLKIFEFLEFDLDLLKISQLNHYFYDLFVIFKKQNKSLSIYSSKKQKIEEKLTCCIDPQKILSLTIFLFDQNYEGISLSKFISLKSLETNQNIKNFSTQRLKKLSLLHTFFPLLFHADLIKSCIVTLKTLELERFSLSKEELLIIASALNLEELNLKNCKVMVKSETKSLLKTLNIRKTRIENLSVSDIFKFGLENLLGDPIEIIFFSDIENHFLNTDFNLSLKKITFGSEIEVSFEIILKLIENYSNLEELTLLINTKDFSCYKKRFESIVKSRGNNIYLNSTNAKEMISGMLNFVVFTRCFSENSLFLQLLKVYLPKQLNLKYIIYQYKGKIVRYNVFDIINNINKASNVFYPGMVAWAVLKHKNILDPKSLRYDEDFELINDSSLIVGVYFSLEKMVIRPKNFLGKISIDIGKLSVKHLEISNFSFLLFLNEEIIKKVGKINRLQHLEIIDFRKFSESLNLNFECLKELKLQSFVFTVNCELEKNTKKSLRKVLKNWKTLKSIKIKYINQSQSAVLKLLSMISSKNIMNIELNFESETGVWSYYTIVKDFLASHSKLERFNIEFPLIVNFSLIADLENLLDTCKNHLKELFFINISALSSKTFEFFTYNENIATIVNHILCSYLIKHIKNYNFFKINSKIISISEIYSRNSSLTITDHNYIENFVLFNLHTLKSLKLYTEPWKVFLIIENSLIFNFLNLKLTKIELDFSFKFNESLIAELFLNSKILKISAFNIIHEDLLTMLKYFARSSSEKLKIFGEKKEKSCYFVKEDNKINVILNNCTSPFEIYRNSNLDDICEWEKSLKRFNLNGYDPIGQKNCLEMLLIESK